MNDAGSQLAPAQRMTAELRRLNTGLLLGAIALIALLVATQNFPACFDEPLFKANCDLYEIHGLSEKFLQEMRGQAPGPLYQILHGLTSPITGYDIRAMRLINLAIFLAALGASYLLYRRVERGDLRRSLFTTASLFLFPVTWVCAGLAITQAPSWLFATLAVLLMLNPLPPASRGQLLPLVARGILIGLSLGAAALGRITFLVLWPVMLFLLVRSWPDRRYLIVAAASVVSCTGMVLPLVRVWGGLVPPDQRASFMRDAAYLNVMPVLVAFVYLFLVILWINPAALWVSRRGLLGVVGGFIALFMLTLAGFGVRHHSAIIGRIASFASPEAISSVPFALYGALTIWVMMAVGTRIREHWSDVPFVAVALAGLLVLGTMVKSTKMGPTYLFQALPFLLPVITTGLQHTLFLTGRILISLILGAVTLRYFMGETWL
jgi:hypothetical protein